jgi:hypothetical protein
MNTHRYNLLAIACVAMFTTAASAQEEAAQFLPAGTGAFVQINDMATWRHLIDDDPLFGPLRDALPHNRHHDAWLSIQQTLGMSGDEIIDRYFGSRVVVAGPKPGWNQPITLMMRIAPDHSQALIDRLELKALPKSGAFAMYSTRDNSTRFAFGKQWVAVAQSQHEPYLRQVLDDVERTDALANDPQFQQWMDRLPADRMAFGFFRGHASDHTAAVAVINDPSRLTVHYVGRPAHVDAVFEQIGDASAREVGPLPRSVLAVASINLRDPSPDNTAPLDRLLGGKNFATDILAHLDAPLLLFMGQNNTPDITADTAPDNAPGRRGDSPDKSGVSIPVIGMAVKMRDAKVADDLTAMVDNAMLVASVATVNWGTPPIMTQNARYGDHRYHIADVGVALAVRTKRDELMQVRLSYGPVGDWFVICSNDQYFNTCIDAAEDESKQLRREAWFVNAPIDEVDQPIATVMLRASAASAQLRVWTRHFSATTTDAAMPAGMPPSDVAAGAISLADVLDGCESITAQLHRDGDVLVGRMHVIRTASQP